MKSSFLYQATYSVIALAIIFGLIRECNVFLIDRWSSGDFTSRFEDRQEIYKFLMFPKTETVQIYADTTLQKPVGTLDRAVIVNGQEIKDGIVAINLYPDKEGLGYLKSDSLSLLPNNSNQKWLENARKFVQDEGNDFGIEWDVALGPDGNQIVHYVSIDREHIRSTTYTYVTDGEKVLGVSQPVESEGFTSAALFIYDIPILLILLLIAHVIKRRIFRVKMA